MNKLEEYINNVHGGNKSHAAKALRISRRMIYLYLKGKAFPVRQKTQHALKSAGIEVPHL